MLHFFSQVKLGLITHRSPLIQLKKQQQKNIDHIRYFTLPDVIWQAKVAADDMLQQASWRFFR